MATDTRIHASTFAGFDTPNSMVTITMSTDQGRELHSLLGNPNLTGSWSGQDEMIAALRDALSKVYPY